MNTGRPGCGSLQAVINILMASAIGSVGLVSDQATAASPSQSPSLPPAVPGDDAASGRLVLKPASCLVYILLSLLCGPAQYFSST